MTIANEMQGIMVGTGTMSELAIGWCTYNADNISFDVCTAGYFNTTSAIDAVQFKMASGNIDSGTITLYGIN